MKRYIQNLHAKEPHQKREFALHAAAALTAVIFLVWLSTLGARFVGQGGAQSTIADTNAASLVAATAGAGTAFQNQIRAMQQPAEGSVPTSYPASANDGTAGQYPTPPSSNSNQGGATVIGAPDSPATTLSQ